MSIIYGMVFGWLLIIKESMDYLCFPCLFQGSESPMMLGDSKSDLEDVDP